jgi:low temperature requirement protein LtrA
VIVALGETVLASGVALSEAELWTPELLLALLTTFVSTLGLWWLYFGTSGKTATDVITHAEDPGRMGASFHYVHAVLVGGVIVAAGHDLVMAHPQSVPGAAQAAAVVAGPILFLLGCALYKRIVTRAWPHSHLVGALAAGRGPGLRADGPADPGRAGGRHPAGRERVGALGLCRRAGAIAGRLPLKPAGAAGG